MKKAYIISVPLIFTAGILSGAGFITLGEQLIATCIAILIHANIIDREG